MALIVGYYPDNEHINNKINGIHCEGSIYRTIFTYFMWDIIFDDNISYVFQTPYQEYPLDMFTEWFFLNRKQLVEDQVERLSKFNDEDIEQLIYKIYNEHWRESVIGIYWDRFELMQFIEICKAVGGYGISNISLLLAKNYRYWSGGLPDLLLWRKVKQDEFECKIVEVKGPRDNLSEKQNCWILYLQKYAKLDVCIAKIKKEF